MKKIIIYLMLMLSLLLQGCQANDHQQAKSQVKYLIENLSSCAISKQSLQQYVYDDVTLVINQFNSYSPLEQLMMCGLYQMMYDNTWDIKEVKIINDSAVAIIIFDQYRYQDALNDLMQELLNTFGDDVYQTGLTEESLPVKEVNLVIQSFYTTNQKKYLLEEMGSISVPMVNSSKEWRVKNLKDIAFFK